MVSALSADGQLLAMQRGLCQLGGARHVQTGNTDVRFCHPGGPIPQQRRRRIGRALVVPGHRQSTVHMVRWENGTLKETLARGDLRAILRYELAGSQVSPQGSRALPGRVPSFPCKAYDPIRFRLAAWARIRSLPSSMSMVKCFSSSTQAIWCVPFSPSASKWPRGCPTATAWDRNRSSAGPPTPEAARHCGSAGHCALAWEPGEGTIT